MGEVIRFVPKAERERTRLIREASAMYDSIFPPADPISEQQDKGPVSHAGHTGQRRGRTNKSTHFNQINCGWFR